MIPSSTRVLVSLLTWISTSWILKKNPICSDTNSLILLELPSSIPFFLAGETLITSPWTTFFFRGSPLDPLCPASSLLLLHPRPQSAGVTRTWNRKVIRCWRRTQEFRILEQLPTSVIWYIAMDNHHIRCSYRYISTDCGESSAMLRIWQTFTEFVEYTLW